MGSILSFTEPRIFVGKHQRDKTKLRELKYFCKTNVFANVPKEYFNLCVSTILHIGRLKHSESRNT